MFNIGSKELNLEIDKKGVNTLRGLSLDMIVNRKSGHSGIVLGAASILYTLYKYHINIDINDKNYINRDRFILSAGHGVPLIYAIDYLLDLLTIDDLKQLRHIDSKTPGHPEKDITDLIEMSTGSLGQGVANAVGIALGEKYLNKETNNTINYYTYVLCGDGELEEGITYEAFSLAGTWNLNKLIVFVDLNQITLDNNLKTTSCEDIKKRFESINFNIIETDDSVKNINEAILNAKKSDKANVILVNTKIGAYSKYEGTNLAHGFVPNVDELYEIKEKLELHTGMFEVNQEVKDIFKEEIINRCKENIILFNKKINNIKNKELINRIINKDYTFTIDDIMTEYNNKSLKELSEDILNEVSEKFPILIGGSADLASSCKTKLNNPRKNICFGIREHAMGGILNGLANVGLRPFGSTFLAFSDYLKPSIRMGAMMNLPVIYIFTHDSITVGEDGPSHQPIEQIPSLELIPNLKIYRPFDFNELIGSYIDIFNNVNPSCLILPRNNHELSEFTSSKGVISGIYEVIKNETDDYINLISNGEELGLVLEVSKNLKEIGIDTRVFSVPCLKNIKANLDNLWKDKLTIAITFTCNEYFYRFTKNVIGINTFGKSASKEELLEYFGYTTDILQSKILEYLNNK